MARRPTVRRVEEFILFDVLYEDGMRTSNRKVPGSELGDIDADLLAKTYIEAQDRQRPVEWFTALIGLSFIGAGIVWQVIYS